MPPRDDTPATQSPQPTGMLFALASAKGNSMRLSVASIIVVLAVVTYASPRAQEPLRLTPAVAQLVVIDAFVTDDKGRPVSTLAAEDFELREDHRLVPIAAFESPRVSSLTSADGFKPGESGAQKATTPDAEVMVIYIDRKLLSPGGRRLAVQQSQALATEHLRAGGRVVVVGEDAHLRPLTPVTADPGEVRKALDRFGELAIQSPGADHERIVLSQFEAIIKSVGCIEGLPQLINVVRDYARWRAIDTQETRDRLNRLVDALVGLPGRKAFVYVSEGLEQRPGIHLFEQIFSICPEALHKEGTQILAAMQEIETSSLMKEASARANAARVTFYPIDARGLMSATSMDISRWDRRFIPGAKNDFIRDANLVNSYQLLAEETGGFPIVRGLSPAVATKRLQAEAAGHYVLAFAPARDPDGKAHDITVQLKKERRGIRIRHRMSYLHAEPSVQRGQRALSALMFGLEENGLRATLDIQRTPTAASGETSATVRIRVSLDALRFEDSAEGRQARVRVVVALRSVNGDASRAPAVVREKEFTIASAAVTTPPTSTHDVVVDVPVDGSSYDFAVGIEDIASGVATYLRRTLDRADTRG
ncbi:MAG: VWA domain-containing protein [Vicinamibacteria bacterium]|nr:VWA domain-containing protein [Vicinamibacteria bacterium]